MEAFWALDMEMKGLAEGRCFDLAAAFLLNILVIKHMEVCRIGVPNRYVETLRPNIQSIAPKLSKSGCQKLARPCGVALIS